MRLSEVTFRESVAIPGTGAQELRVRGDDRCALSLDQGLVSCVFEKGTLLVPISNVRFMSPAPVAKK